MRTHLAVLAGLAAGLAMALAGCSIDIGGDSDSDSASSSSEPMSQSDLEKKVLDGLTVEDQNAEPDVTCSGDLEAEVDATQDCHITVGQEFADVHVVVTEVDDDGISDADINTYLPGDRVAQAVKADLDAKGVAVDSVACDDELAGEEGATVTCTAAQGKQNSDIEVTTTNVDGLFMNFRYQLK
jgi:hypothetical protein